MRWPAITTTLLVSSLGCSPAPEPTSSPARAPAAEPAPGELIRVDDNLYGRFIRAQSAPKIGDQAPRFSLPTSDGGEVVLDELLARGKPVVLVFYRGFW